MLYEISRIYSLTRPVEEVPDFNDDLKQRF